MAAVDRQSNLAHINNPAMLNDWGYAGLFVASGWTEFAAQSWAGYQCQGRGVLMFNLAEAVALGSDKPGFAVETLYVSVSDLSEQVFDSEARHLAC